ncbi:hypothetical protein OC842_003015 [Tilletia horrida]|uniref:Uncharacterized protein n=1 Tax=Tilletia horrida TaxID=155126 RepID=A0AAN6GCK2_9BASI|nr:hypothetical protein OC842_003015 [Tilletia horrida]
MDTTGTNLNAQFQHFAPPGTQLDFTRVLERDIGCAEHLALDCDPVLPFKTVLHAWLYPKGWDGLYDGWETSSYFGRRSTRPLSRRAPSRSQCPGTSCSPAWARRRWADAF